MYWHLQVPNTMAALAFWGFLYTLVYDIYPTARFLLKERIEQLRDKQK